MTLLEGVYDAAAGELNYAVRIVAPTDEGPAKIAVPMAEAPSAPAELGAGHLFIDNTRYVPGQYIDATGGVTSEESP